MVKVKCPRTDCDFETEDTDIVLAAALLNAHTTEHQLRGGQGNTGAKPPPVERPKLQAACPKADWQVFLSRWRTFKLAVNID